MRDSDNPLEGKEMKVLTGKKIDLNKTYQEPFRKEIKCPNPECTSTVIAAVQIIDDKGEIAKRPPITMPRAWPHDAIVIMIYICPQCSAALTLWNQA